VRKIIASIIIIFSIFISILVISIWKREYYLTPMQKIERVIEEKQNASIPMIEYEKKNILLGIENILKRDSYIISKKIIILKDNPTHFFEKNRDDYSSVSEAFDKKKVHIVFLSDEKVIVTMFVNGSYLMTAFEKEDS
jgi:hypothetical protein